jgi:hypothetical protein
MDTLPFSQRPKDAPGAGHPDDAMWEFESEVPSRQRRSSGPSIGIGHVVATAALLAAGAWFYQNRTPSAPPNGTLRVESAPPGAAVEIDGSLRGLTPYRTGLPAGTYTVLVIGDHAREELSARVTSGVETVYHVRLAGLPAEFEAEPAGTGRGGRLHVVSEPAGAQVLVNDIDRGVAPLTVEELPPGEHDVEVKSGGRSYSRSVTIEAGAITSIVVTLPPSAPVPATGWLAVRSATPLDILEGDHLVGTSDERILLPAGTYDLQFVAEALGFRASRRVTIAGGGTTPVSIALPQSAVAIDAIPWAEVWIDGVAIGPTPVANLLRPIGTHTVELRHPVLGTKHASLTVSLKEPARLSVDMR